MTRSMDTKLLVPLDGSERTLGAVQYLCRTIRPEGKKVVLFHVFARLPEALYDLQANPYNRTVTIKAEVWQDFQRDRIRGHMSEARRMLVDAGFAENAIMVQMRDMREGVARDIMAEARRGYAAVVVKRRGGGRIRDLLMGSVTNKLAGKLTDVPLVIADDSTSSQGMLVALDGSEHSREAVSFLSSMTRGTVHRVTLFHVVRKVDQLEQGEDLPQILREAATEWIEDHMRRIRSLMHEVREEMLASGFDPSLVETRVVTGAGSRAEAIMEEARMGRFGTIVMGRKGHSNVPEHSMGRVTYKILQLARDHSVWVVG